MNDELRSRFARIRLLAMDVDGVLTDGGLLYSSTGEEHKRFHISDGLGIVLLRLFGVRVAWISGRSHHGVERRAKDLGVDYLLQGIRDKEAALIQLSEHCGMPLSEIAYIGDDWNDLLAFRAAGVRVAVANAAVEVKAAADLITQYSGGEGAVREVCMALLDARGQREEALRRYLEGLGIRD